MGLLKKLFGGAVKPESLATTARAASPTVINQSETDPPLKVATGSITHAFVALTHADMSYWKTLEGQVAKLNRLCQPRLWSVEFKAKFGVFAAAAMDSGFPDITSVGPALESVGLSPPYSLVINTMTISCDGGQTQTKVLAGFAFRDRDPKIVLPRNNGCIPAMEAKDDFLVNPLKKRRSEPKPESKEARLLLVQGTYNTDAQQAQSSVSSAIEEFQRRHPDIRGTGDEIKIIVGTEGTYFVLIPVICTQSFGIQLQDECATILRDYGFGAKVDLPPVTRSNGHMIIEHLNASK